MLPREAVVTYLEPAPALFAEACARKGVLSVAHPPGVSRNAIFGLTVVCLRALCKILAYLFWEVWFPISVWFEWVQDVEVSRAAQHGFLGLSRVTSRDLQRVIAGMVARGVYARTNDKHWGAFLPHRSKLWGLPVLSQASR